MDQTLISAEQLLALRAGDTPLMVFDCSFELMNPAAGEEHYRQSHIAGAVYAHLDHALSDKGTPDASGHYQPHADAASGGRHPLPSREKFAMWLSSVGFSNAMQAVVYDRNNANYCGRLWWMLKWAGHEAVAVLDGGLQAWQAAGGAVRAGEEPSHFQSNFKLRPPLRTLTTTQDVAGRLGQSGQTLVDARATPRFKGEVEPLDPVAGHIPGALNRPFGLNIGADGRFKPAAQLRAEFEELLAGATLQPWSTTAAAASARCPTWSPWKSRAFRPAPCTRAAGANGAGTRSGRWSGGEQAAQPQRPRGLKPSNQG